MRRVVITGMGALSPLGLDAASLQKGLAQGASGIRPMPEWTQVEGLQAKLAGLVPPFEEKIIPRPMRRTMGRTSILAALACRQAADHAGLAPETLASVRTGLYFGSTTGSAAVMEEFFLRFSRQGVSQTPGTDFMKVMGHTTAVNAALFLGIHGRVESLTAACATSAQTVGSAYDAVRCGFLDVVIAGGSDELHPSSAGTFDIVAAASRVADPGQAPRPFDADRDGLVLGEGAGALVLEERSQALARGAKIYGEIRGYATTCSADHMTQPSPEAMEACMRQTLAAAQVEPDRITMVNAHATGTLQGDAAEAVATDRLFGFKTPVTALKGQIGHTLAASGVLEVIGVLGMMAEKQLWPIHHLKTPLAEGQNLRLVREYEPWNPGLVLKNTFAFGGINASLALAPASMAGEGTL